MKIQLIFPHQLFEGTQHLKEVDKIYLVEEWLFFQHYPFHQQKIAFHRASMRAYFDKLVSLGFHVVYIEAIDELSDVRKLVKSLAIDNERVEIHYLDTYDNWLEKRIRQSAQSAGISAHQHASPYFISSNQEFQSYAVSKKKLLQNDFYIRNRKQLDVLMNQGEPEGGKWSFDADNRKAYPNGKRAPKTFTLSNNSYHDEATEYVNKHFSHHHGKLDTRFRYPIQHEEAKDWLHVFLQERFSEFGTYEDAIVSEEYCLHHSVLSPMINTGLLLVTEVVEQALAHAREHQLPINQVEGFIRQLIGWREYIYGVYTWKGSEQRNSNFFRHEQPMPAAFYNGTTGIPPIDHTIQKAFNSAYNHHIERLMVLSNFMLLCEISPHAIYQWFMEFYIDAYDWVMVPNVYGMGQYADGGLMCTKPYISSSNYVLKMSNYKKGEWCEIWDALFWRFMNKHRDYLSKNFRLSMLIKTYDKMSEEKKLLLQNRADRFLEKIHSNNLLV